MSQPTKGRLKRGVGGRRGVIHLRRIINRQEDTLDHDPKEIPPPPPPPPCLAVPAGSEGTSPIIRCTTPGVGQKDSQSDPERKSLAQECLQTHYPKDPGLMSTPTALLRIHFEMDIQESASSTQNTEKTKSAWLLAYAPQTTKMK